MKFELKSIFQLPVNPLLHKHEKLWLVFIVHNPLGPQG